MRVSIRVVWVRARPRLGPEVSLGPRHVRVAGAGASAPRTDSRLGRHEPAGANISSAHQRQPGPVASRHRLRGSTPSAFMHIVSVPSAQYVGSSCVVNCSANGKNGSISLLCIACAGGGRRRCQPGRQRGRVW